MLSVTGCSANPWGKLSSYRFLTRFHIADYNPVSLANQASSSILPFWMGQGLSSSYSNKWLQWTVVQLFGYSGSDNLPAMRKAAFLNLLLVNRASLVGEMATGDCLGHEAICVNIVRIGLFGVLDSGETSELSGMCKSEINKLYLSSSAQSLWCTVKFWVATR